MPAINSYSNATPAAGDKLVGSDVSASNATSNFLVSALAAYVAGVTFLSGIAADRPSAGTAGRLYYATDTDALSRDNGSSWDAVTLDAGQIATGTVATARLGSGTANSSSYLRGDQTWATISSGGAQSYGTTAQRNAATPATGDIWFDSTIQAVGFYDGTIWRNISTWFQLGAIATDTFTAADSTNIIGHVTDTGSKTWASFNGGSGTGTITGGQVTFGGAAIVGLNVGVSAYACTMVITAPTTTGWYIRHSGTNTANGISIKNDGGTWKWYKDNTLAESSGIAYSAGQTIKVAVSGGTHTLTIGGSSDDYTDSTYTSLQYVGCIGNITIDNLVITTD